MKMKSTALFALFFWSISMFSQNAFPHNQAIWKLSSTTIVGPFIEHHALCGDTLIDGIYYRKFSSLQVDLAMNIVGETYLGAIRTEGEKVFYLPEINPQEILLYDFSLEAGDSIELVPQYASNSVTRYVDSVKTETLAGANRKLIYFRPGYANAPVEFWIEGIGSNYGVINRASDPGPDFGSELLCYAHEDEYLNLTLIECFLPELNNCPLVSSVYEEGENYFSIYPNPTSERIFIEMKKGEINHLEVNLYDASGRLEKHFNVYGEEIISLDIEGVNSGLYFLEIKNKGTGERKVVSKIVVVE